MLIPEELWLTNYIQHNWLAEIDIARHDLQEYVNGSYWESKNNRIAQWNPDYDELCDLVTIVFTITLLNAALSYQAITGMVASRIPNVNKLDAARIAAEVIAVISYSGLIKIERRGYGKSILVYTEYSITTSIPVVDLHSPEDTPITVKSNTGCFLGASENYHTSTICLDHLNRMNNIMLSLDSEFLRRHKECPTFTMDTPDKEQQWRKFYTDSYQMYDKVIRNGNKFYLNHKYDARGRTYCGGYYINYQGASFKKAIIQLANKEKLNKC